jgi:hypothetical protein
LACSISYVGLLIPSLEFLGIVFTFVLMADLPISLPAYFFGWKYSALAVTWILSRALFGGIYWAAPCELFSWDSLIEMTLRPS